MIAVIGPADEFIRWADGKDRKIKRKVTIDGAVYQFVNSIGDMRGTTIDGILLLPRYWELKDLELIMNYIKTHAMRG